MLRHDIYHLATPLPRFVRDGHVDSGLARYDAQRRPRTEKFVKTALRAACVTQTDSRAAIAVRNTAARLVPPRLAARGMHRMLKWAPPD